MDKIFSARIQESVLAIIERISDELHISKKKVIEEAVRKLWENVHQKGSPDFFSKSFGAWRREESPETLIKKSRAAVRKSFERHQA